MSATKTKITLKKNKEINKWWHEESKLVFKSNKENILVGIVKYDIYSDLF